MHDLKRHLDAEQVPPTRLAVEGLVRAGRRKQRRRRILGAAAVVAVLPLGLGFYALRPSPPPLPDPVTSAFPSSCVGEQLSVPDGTWASVGGADPTGRYIVASLATGPRNATNNTRLAIWHDGELSIVDPPGNTISRVAVNADGVVAGAGLASSDPTLSPAWIYKDGQFTTLTGTSYISLSAINGGGDVLGHYNGSVVWRGGGGTPQPLPKSDGMWTLLPTDIDDDGTVVGVSVADTRTAIVWPADGTAPKPLPVPKGMDPDTSAIAVRNGRAIGISGNFPEPYGNREPGLGVVWDLNNGTASKLAGGLARATDINEQGWLAGFTAEGEGAISDGRERLVRLTLPPQVATAGWDEASTALTISDGGRIVTASARIYGLPRQFPVVKWVCS